MICGIINLVKGFLKDNWFRLIIVFCLLLLTFSVVWYLKTSASKIELSNLKEEKDRSLKDSKVSASKIGLSNNFKEASNNSSKDLTKIISSLYPNIIYDYLGSNEGIILQDFGQPKSKGDAVGFIDDSFWSEDHIFYNYPLEGGNITFYLDKQTGNTSYVEVNLSDNSNVRINVPGLGDKGDGTKPIILGESTFGDIFDKNKGGDTLKKVETYQGGSAGNDYTNLDFYFGKYGEYHEFTFGVPGLYDERINTDYMVLKNVKPSKLRIR